MLIRILVIAVILYYFYGDYDQRKYDLLYGQTETHRVAVFGNPTLRLEEFRASSRRLYPPLIRSEDALRVLIIMPARSGVIRCRTVPIAFSQQPRYRALSYAWGPAEPTLSIILNGVEIGVRENLWFALYHLRHSSEEVSLWTDALCINQRDDIEIARLIPQMAMVYQRAEEVVVWLDNAAIPPSLQSHLPQISKWQEAPPELDQNYHTIWWHQAVPWLYRLVHAPYWQRTWIVQELGEAVKVRVHFGGGDLPWSSFVSAVHTLKNVFPYVSGVDRIDALNKLRQLRREGEIFALSALVNQFHGTFCSRPEDHLFAFLGMADDDSVSFITANYGKHLAHRYFEFVQYLSQSKFDSIIREIEIVHRSALLRFSLARKEGTISHFNMEPCLAEMKAEPYDSFFLESGLDGKLTLHSKTIYRREWLEWHQCSSRLQRSCWLPTTAELFEDWRDTSTPIASTVKAQGMLVAQIVQIGPTVASILRSSQAVKEWKLGMMEQIAGRAVQKSVVVQFVRMMEVLTRPAAANEIFSIGSFCTTSHCPSKLARLFVGSNGVLGIVSPAVQVGDSIVQFFNSTSSAVARKSMGDWSMVGRAAIVKSGHTSDWDIINDISVFLEASRNHTDEGCAVTIVMDTNTLTQLNLNSVREDDSHRQCHPQANPITPRFFSSIYWLTKSWGPDVFYDFVCPFGLFCFTVYLTSLL